MADARRDLSGNIGLFGKLSTNNGQEDNNKAITSPICITIEREYKLLITEFFTEEDGSDFISAALEEYERDYCLDKFSAAFSKYYKQVLHFNACLGNPYWKSTNTEYVLNGNHHIAQCGLVFYLNLFEKEFKEMSTIGSPLGEDKESTQHIKSKFITYRNFLENKIKEVTIICKKEEQDRFTESLQEKPNYCRCQIL